MNTGTRKIDSDSGLLTTMGYKFGDQQPHYALEGSIAITGALVQWVRDNLGLIEKSPDIESLARTVNDNGGVYFVPAFSGLYAPYWKDSARGVIAGPDTLCQQGHIARAVPWRQLPFKPGTYSKPWKKTRASSWTCSVPTAAWWPMIC